MSLKILIAGCLPKDRWQIEGVVRKAFQDLPESDPWNVSLVKLGSSWSISLEGPELNSQFLGLSAPEDHLAETIAEALRTNGTTKKQPAPPPAAPEGLGKAEGLTARTVAAPVETKAATDQGDRYDCHACRQSFKIVYVADPRDAKVKAPVACPNCWEITEVSVPESAAATEEYRAELDG